MSSDLLAALKKLQHQRGDSSPFQSHVDFLQWCDSVSPLLAFNEKLQRSFYFAVESAKSHHNMGIADAPQINDAIGYLNQAIVALQQPSAKVVPIPHAAGNPAANPPNAVKDWHDMPLGKIAIGVVVIVLAAGSLYIFRHHLGIPL